MPKDIRNYPPSAGAMLFVAVLANLAIGTYALPQTTSRSIISKDYPKEAYFNGTASIRLLTPMSLHQHSGLSFRTCKGGGLFTQTYNDNTISLDVNAEGLKFTAIINGQKYMAKLNAKLLNNAWQNINLINRLGNLTLTAAGLSQIVANETFNAEILKLPDINRTLILGYGFKGCILQGPGILFDDIENYGARLGTCPSDSRDCPPCKSGPCKNGASCIEDGKGDFMCICQPGYTGHLCDSPHSFNTCLDSPCKNKAVCSMDNNHEYKCECLPGWAGQHCESNVDECASNPCKNNGHCIDGINNYTCICANNGYEGRNCEINADECANNPCLNKGKCFNYGGYYCQCPQGFSGQNCELNLNECFSQPCENGGSCVDDVGSYHCNCPSGFIGDHCERRYSCENATCPPDSICLDVDNQLQCVCKPGYMGNPPNCTINFCASNPCINGGTCTSNNDDYNCTCTEEWKGKNCNERVDECVLQPCLNGGTCINEYGGYSCNCTEGFSGENCGKNESCADMICPENKICVDTVVGAECKCKEGFTGINCSIINYCAKKPCNNGQCIDLGEEGFHCNCNPGYSGHLCEDVDECETKGLCNNGICVNNNGSYKCYCEPGWTGLHCDENINECLSAPCKNNAKCVDVINNYECICAPGYTGKNCEHNINECESNPCQNNAKCIDEIAAYKCNCTTGFTGAKCEINIDDCESQPCLNYGRCKDGINNYTCDCSGTGFEGLRCEKNIDECLSSPCVNGAECIDRIKSYKCQCFPGYDGQNCENDIDECKSSPCQYNGTCLQRSNQTLYKNSARNLPAIFQQDFNYAEASGYECLCVQGLTGKNCEKNINECESSPCRSGRCKDRIGGYTCECDEGFEGDHCQHNIDECLRYHPCEHGTCIDSQADYFCICDSKYGGKNCSVELIGCQGNACQNGGTCLPYLRNETVHSFNCTCPNGFHGDICEDVTTMSYSKKSYVKTNISRDEGYDIQFRFRTTLPNGLLAIGAGTTYYILELVDGKLNLRSSILNKWEGVFIGSGLNNSKWQKVFAAMNSTHLVLSANEEQTIYPISLNEGPNPSPTFPITYIGGTISSFWKLAHSPPYFVGCTEDIIINGKWIYPGRSLDGIWMEGIESSCPREEQCSPNPCKAGGHCTDIWRDFSCQCERPYLGHTCQYNMTAATFGHDKITDGYVTVKPQDFARKAVRSIVDISMFIRTREERGHIFYLGSEEIPDLEVKSSDHTYIAAQLKGGELLVRMQLNGTEGPYTVGGAKLNDGNNHLIQLIRNVTLVQVKINGTEYFRKTISATGQLNTSVLYLGGLPHASRYTRQVDSRNTEEEGIPQVNFKGIIQDVQISNGTITMAVEFFPLKARDIPSPIQFGSVTFDPKKILAGVISDNVCDSNPCYHNGTCTVTWNDFYCLCPRGYTGKTCQVMEFCELQDCPDGSKCQNLDSGYECIANATFDGVSTSFTYVYSSKNYKSVNVTIDTIKIVYRSNSGGTLLNMAPRTGDQHFTVSVYKDMVTVAWKLDENNQDTISFNKDRFDGDWTSILLKMRNTNLACGHAQSFDEKSSSSEKFNLHLWYNLLLSGSVTLGGLTDNSWDRSSYVTVEADKAIDGNSVELVDRRLTSTIAPDYMVSGEPFKGCMGEVRIGSMLLHYFTFEEIYNNANFTPLEYLGLRTNRTNIESIGCRLCFNKDCINGGRCHDQFMSYACDCPAGYDDVDCSRDIDECADHHCENNATCIDGTANYTCECLPGWQGWRCDQDIDECRLRAPCRNSGICMNLRGGYQCHCPEEFTGNDCEIPRLITCKDHPCANGSTCKDIINPKTRENFTCICMPGYEGSRCDDVYCKVTPCKNSGRCRVPPYQAPKCSCPEGFDGRLCETNIDDCVADASGKLPCKNEGKCYDGINSFSCNCTGTGYQGSDCSIDIDECQLPTTDCGYGTCVNLNGTFICNCTSGYCGYNCRQENPCREDICANGGTCQCGGDNGYICECTEGYTGLNCTVAAHFLGSQALDIAVIVGPIVGILLLIAIGSLTALFMMARKKRATRGTYSPSAQEFSNPRVEMDNVMKPPPEERLI